MNWDKTLNTPSLSPSSSTSRSEFWVSFFACLPKWHNQCNTKKWSKYAIQCNLLICALRVYVTVYLTAADAGGDAAVATTTKQSMYMNNLLLMCLQAHLYIYWMKLLQTFSLHRSLSHTMPQFEYTATQHVVCFLAKFIEKAFI